VPDHASHQDVESEKPIDDDNGGGAWSKVSGGLYMNREVVLENQTRTSTPQPNNLHRSYTNSTPLQQVPIHTTTHPKMSNPGNIVGGHKANLNNPNTSEESKQHSRDVLNNEFNGGDVESASDQGKNPNNV
jgi:hypothetical protein